MRSGRLGGRVGSAGVRGLPARTLGGPWSMAGHISPVNVTDPVSGSEGRSAALGQI